MKQMLEEVLSGIDYTNLYNLSFEDIENRVINRDIADFIFEVLDDAVSERNENIFKYYCINQYTMKEISNKYEISESRISQIIKQCKFIIRYNLNEYYYKNKKYIKQYNRELTKKRK